MMDAIRGWKNISNYFDEYFTEKETKPTPAQLKAHAGSIKKFYQCMYETKVLEKNSYDHLCWVMEKDMPEWLKKLEDNDDEEN